MSTLYTCIREYILYYTEVCVMIERINTIPFLTMP
uniref:Uncharacterized protein n=1 Tax=Rhizophora mucronata TaxID=61149 RepID=A0A2P2PK18_RHIMU